MYFNEFHIFKIIDTVGCYNGSIKFELPNGASDEIAINNSSFCDHVNKIIEKKNIIIEKEEEIKSLNAQLKDMVPKGDQSQNYLELMYLPLGGIVGAILTFLFGSKYFSKEEDEDEDGDGDLNGKNDNNNRDKDNKDQNIVDHLEIDSPPEINQLEVENKISIARLEGQSQILDYLEDNQIKVPLNSEIKQRLKKIHEHTKNEILSKGEEFNEVLTIKDNEIENLKQQLNKTSREVNSYPDFYEGFNVGIGKIYNRIEQIDQSIANNSPFKEITKKILESYTQKPISGLATFAKKDEFILNTLKFTSTEELKGMDRDLFVKRYILTVCQDLISGLYKLNAYAEADKTILSLGTELKISGADISVIKDTYSQLCDLLDTHFDLDLFAPTIGTEIQESEKYKLIEYSFVRSNFYNDIMKLMTNVIYDVTQPGIKNEITGEIVQLPAISKKV